MPTKKSSHTSITPLIAAPALAAAIGVRELYVKCEQAHPYGSHKGRSIPFMIDHYLRRGATTFSISSSGNAALAAARHAVFLMDHKNTSLELDIFMSPRAHPTKVALIKEAAAGHASIRLHTVERPLAAHTVRVGEGAISLRQSTDDIALLGYESLAKEITAAVPTIAAIFIGSSSGTTAQALAQFLPNNIAVHVVQTTACHPLAVALGAVDMGNEPSLADAIVDTAAHRTAALTPLIQEHNGQGYIVNNETLQVAIDLVRTHTGMEITANGALGIAGLMEAVYMGKQWPKDAAIVCIVGGM
jgi:threonine dehydratase